MPLAPPPEDLSAFPRRRSSASVRTLYRITWHRDRATGAVSGPWHFSHDGRGRFDLPEPHGTCYWSNRRSGAFLEVFRGTSTVAATDLLARRLVIAQAPVLRLAHLLSPRALPYGVTAALSTQPDYALPQRWAMALHDAGFEGLVGSCSHDPTSRALNVAVFGAAGTRAPGGWTTRTAPVQSDPVLLAELAPYGVRIVPVPHTVRTVPPAL
jgi:hypothetical protein